MRAWTCRSDYDGTCTPTSTDNTGHHVHCGYEDLPEGTVIEPGAFKPQKGMPLKIAGVPVGTCDIDVDDEGNVTYTAEFKRDHISPELYDQMFGRYTPILSNVFDVSEEAQQRADPSVGTIKAPFRLPRS